MELILVRHAQPQWVIDDSAINDPGLSELGSQQARSAAAALSDLDLVDELLVSTSRRARETAAPIAEALSLEPSVHDWLHEIRLPATWDGTPAEEVGRHMRERRNMPRSQWWKGIGEGGEAFSDFHSRVTSGLQHALADRGVQPHRADPEHLLDIPGDIGRIVIVAHAGTNSVILSHLLGIDPQPWEWERFSSAHASVTRLSTSEVAGGSIISLELFSGVDHFTPDQVTR